MKSRKSKKPISLKVYEKLKSDIINNKLKPGEKLIECDIAADLKVSRTPIREALKQLEQEGFVTYFPRRGSIVSKISIEEAMEIYEVREYLESLSIKLICTSISRKDIKLLEKIVKEMEESIEKKDYDNLYRLHTKWTDTVINFTTNKYLKAQMINLYQHLDRLRRVSLYKSKHAMQAYEETKDILQAIIDGDEIKSERLARHHVRNASKRFIENINEEKDIDYK